ncbi:MAG: protein kinase, partial [Planctomycetota bacterium]
AERQALAMMDHPNIARMIDGGTTESGIPYFVMELVEGIPIHEYCDRHRLTIRERIELLVEVCRAVQHAHTKGIIHRDLKPSNVLVTIHEQRPLPKVIDFGLAKATEHQMQLSEQSWMTEIGQIVGTLQYMSPEQAEFNQLNIDTRTDIYALGVMLFELLTGTTPIERASLKQGSLLEVLDAIRTVEPPKPSVRLSASTEEVRVSRRIESTKLQQLLGGELDWITARALEKDRTRRYDTASALAEDLVRYLEDRPVVARPPSNWYYASKLMRRHRGKFLAACSFVLLLLIGFASTGSLWLSASRSEKRANDEARNAMEALEKARNERDRANEQEQIARQQAERANTATLLAQRSDAEAKFQLANARFDAGRAADAMGLLHRVDERFRDNFEWRYCNQIFDGSGRTIYGMRARVFAVAVDPTDSYIAVGGQDFSIRLWDKNGQEIRTLERHDAAVYDVCFNSTGGLLASAGWDGKVKIWDPKSGTCLHTYSGKEGVFSVCFDPSEERVIFGGQDGVIRVWDFESNKVVQELSGH